jgi:cell division protein FtsB
MRYPIIVALLFGALTLGPAWTGAHAQGSAEEVAAEAADTKAEHEALAKEYSEKAAEARKLASRHHAMGRSYMGGRASNKEAFGNHCKRVSAKNEELAKEYEELAKLHEEAAKNAP